MKRIFIVLLYFVIILTINGCRSIYRVYDDEDLSVLARQDFGFSEVLVFKIVYPDTALELTGKSYNNSGVIIGIRNGQHSMVFVPKMVAEDPFLLDIPFTFNLKQIYDDLRSIDDNNSSQTEIDFFADYGGLSITVEPYDLISEENSDLNFETRIFFTVTTDEDIFYIGFVEDGYVIFDNDYVIID